MEEASSKQSRKEITEVDGIRLISAERLRQVTDVSSRGMDQVFGNRRPFGVGGVGGSFACGDSATGIAFALTKNRLAMDFSTATELSELVTKAIPRRGPDRR
jgi:hypothetical protein